MRPIHTAFSLGFEYGATVGHPSPRIAEFTLRAFNIDPTDTAITLFCNGADDGVIGDRARLDDEL